MSGAAAHILVLGGTTEASALVTELARSSEVMVTTSLAGATATPRPLPGELRRGGFGGTDGLAAWLRDQKVTAVVDGTHPFAAVMPWHAAAACDIVGVPRLRLRRPGWTPRPGDNWTVVMSLAGAADELIGRRARRVFLSTGRRELTPFAVHHDLWFLVRSVDAPDAMPLEQATVLLDRGPFDLDGEMVLMRTHSIDTLVTKNSGGTAAAPKLAAARSIGIRVIMVARPPSPPGLSVEDADAAFSWCRATTDLDL